MTAVNPAIAVIAKIAQPTGFVVRNAIAAATASHMLAANALNPNPSNVVALADATSSAVVIPSCMASFTREDSARLVVIAVDNVAALAAFCPITKSLRPLVKLKISDIRFVKPNPFVSCGKIFIAARAIRALLITPILSIS